MDGGEPDRWSEVAAGWAASWGGIGLPVWRHIADTARVGPGTRVLDVGCGSGDLLAFLGRRGATLAGADPAPGMLAVARGRSPGADLRDARAEALPWPDHSFDVVTAVNALQFADELDAALAEIRRVLVPGGRVAIANWAEAERNDLEVVEAAVAAEFDDEVPPDDELRLPGGLARLLEGAGYELAEAGIVETPWEVPDADALVRGVLLGEDADRMRELTAVVVGAAAPFRRPDGGYRLANAFRFAVAMRPASPRDAEPERPPGIG